MCLWIMCLCHSNTFSTRVSSQYSLRFDIIVVLGKKFRFKISVVLLFEMQNLLLKFSTLFFYWLKYG